MFTKGKSVLYQMKYLLLDARLGFLFLDLLWRFQREKYKVYSALPTEPQPLSQNYFLCNCREIGLCCRLNKPQNKLEKIFKNLVPKQRSLDSRFTQDYFTGIKAPRKNNYLLRQCDQMSYSKFQ